MIANVSVITDNLDYLLWGRVAEGQPGGVLLTLAGSFLPVAPGDFRARFATDCFSGRNLFAAFRSSL